MPNIAVDSDTGELVGRVVLAQGHAFDFVDSTLTHLYILSSDCSNAGLEFYYSLPVVEVVDLGYVSRGY